MPVSGPDVLLYEKTNKIVTITLNRIERMNSLSYELRERLAEAWMRFRDDGDAWVAILTGAGDRAFCAGLDLVERAEMGKKGRKLPEGAKFFGIEVWKPVIVALNGFAIAGGFALALDGDIRIAADHVELGISETRWNMPAAWASKLSRHVTLSHAMELALWGDGRITAQRGYEMGLINRVVPREKLMEEARSWAERLTYLAPRSVRNLKEIVYRTCSMSPDEGAAFAKALQQNLSGMQDSIEGPRAFAEKRKPTFQDK